MKSRFFAILILILIVFACPVGAAQLKLGYIDMEKALNISLAGQDARKQIDQKAKEYEAEFVEKRKELNDFAENLKKQMAILSPEAKREKERELKQKETDLKRAVKDYQAALQQDFADHSRSISRELMKIAEKVGKKEGYTLILEKSERVVLYADKQIELTEQVVKEYDKEFKSGK